MIRLSIALFASLACCCASQHSLRLACLGEFESGNNDHARGAANEISRYQIIPAVWRQFASHGADPTVPGVARKVAGAVMRFRLGCYFGSPNFEILSDAEWYGLWNAPGQFQFRRWHPTAVVRARAQRFANLCAKRRAQSGRHPDPVGIASQTPTTAGVPASR